jgi:hypothetical protein
MPTRFLFGFLLLCDLIIADRLGQVDKGVHHHAVYNKSKPVISVCHHLKGSSRSERRKKQLEERYRQQSRRYDPTSEQDLDANRVTFLFGHVHHAGGTAFCLLARNNTLANPKDNCNHPDEFKGPPSAPTSGSISQQVAFQRMTPWQFYSVELHMPQHLKYNGPFIYGAILRNPYLLLMSQYRRSQVKFQFKGDLIDLIHLQLKYVGVTTINYRNHMTNLRQEQQSLSMRSSAETETEQLRSRNAAPRNYFRGQAGFILGQFGPTNYTDATIFNMAKRRLKRFSVVALTEFMVESGVVLGAKLGWRVDGFGQRVVNSNGAMDQLVSDLLALSAEEHMFVRYYAGVDVLLYQYAKCLLEREYYQVTNTSLHSYPYAEVDTFFAPT